MSRRRLTLAISIVAVTLLATAPSGAQWIVFDPNNYVQNVLTAARELQQINNQITSLQNEAQMLINQAKNLASLPYSSLQQLQSSIEGDNAPWRPIAAYDDGRKVYIEFPQGIVQGEMPPLFALGPDGKTEIVNYRAYGNLLIVDRLFAAAELRLGGEHQQKVRIVRTDGSST